MREEGIFWFRSGHVHAPTLVQTCNPPTGMNRPHRRESRIPPADALGPSSRAPLDPATPAASLPPPLPPVLFPFPPFFLAPPTDAGQHSNTSSTSPRVKPPITRPTLSLLRRRRLSLMSGGGGGLCAAARCSMARGISSVCPQCPVHSPSQRFCWSKRLL